MEAATYGAAFLQPKLKKQKIVKLFHTYYMLRGAINNPLRAFTTKPAEEVSSHSHATVQNAKKCAQSGRFTSTRNDAVVHENDRHLPTPRCLQDRILPSNALIIHYIVEGKLSAVL
jgi:hypothetical protein